jgi:monoamine oxidase
VVDCFLHCLALVSLAVLGTVIKVYVCYKTWWWRQKGHSGEMLSDEEPVTLYYDATTEKLPALIGFIPAHLAKVQEAISLHAAFSRVP